MNEDCKSSEKNNINFTVQSLACMISIHNILTSYVDDSRFQNNQKIPLEWLITMLRMKTSVSQYLYMWSFVNDETANF